MQFRSRRHLIVWLLWKLSHTVSVCVGPALALIWKRSSWFTASRSRHSTLLRWFISYFPSGFFFFLTPHVMSSHLSLATGRKPEPLACCRSERGWGYILLADAKWTALPPHNAQYWSTFGNGRWHGRGQRRESVCVSIRTPCHLTRHITTAVLHQCSSGLIHS